MANSSFRLVVHIKIAPNSKASPNGILMISESVYVKYFGMAVPPQAESMYQMPNLRL